MITIRKSEDRGAVNFGWLDSQHSFSFGSYHDPRHMGFRALRVINEDRVVPGGGFEEHGHRDMEIISYVLDGALEHKDSTGNGEVLRPGEVQVMGAGTGIRHSEFNHSQSDGVHFLQMWVLPERAGMAPAYGQRDFPRAERQGRLRLIGSRDGRDGSLVIRQDVDLYASLLSAGDELVHPLGEGRHAWVQLARGTVEVNSRKLTAGDGAAVSGERELTLTGIADSELLVYDMA
ncbi:MAG: pirin family protein [Alphaproteobacteria bacterium]|nr:pirin family protein [Alphaproteobacteria bacterium]